MSGVTRRHAALSDIDMERTRQRLKWGRQRHEHTFWACILTEEVGEAAKVCIELPHDIPALRKELIQVAAVAVAWVEHIDEMTGGS